MKLQKVSVISWKRQNYSIPGQYSYVPQQQRLAHPIYSIPPCHAHPQGLRNKQPITILHANDLSLACNWQIYIYEYFQMTLYAFEPLPDDPVQLRVIFWTHTKREKSLKATLPRIILTLVLHSSSKTERPLSWSLQETCYQETLSGPLPIIPLRMWRPSGAVFRRAKREGENKERTYAKE